MSKQNSKTLFSFGTLCHPPLLEIVLGRAVSFSDVKAALYPGYVVRSVKDSLYPVLQPEQDMFARGVLICDLSAHDIERLDFYEACFGYTRQCIEIDVKGQVVQTDCYFGPNDLEIESTVWTIDAWRARWAELSCFAAQEVMRYFGKRDPKDVGQGFQMVRARAGAKVLAARDVRKRLETPQKFSANVHQVQSPYANFFAIEEYDLQYQKFDGQLSPVVNRAVFASGDAAIVLPYDPTSDKILLVEQFRMGPFARNDMHPWCLEPIAGMIDPGETPIETAHREAEEEAGLQLESLELISQSYPSPGGSTGFFHVFIATADLSNVSTYGGAANEQEDIKIHVMPLKKAIDHALNNRFTVMVTQMSILWLAMNKDKFKR